MVGRPKRTLSPEEAASVRLEAVALKAGWRHEDPVGEERAKIVTELQEIAASFPHLLGEHAGLFLGAARNTGLDARGYLISAQLLINAGADLGEVERWAEIGYERTRVKIADFNRRDPH